MGEEFRDQSTIVSEREPTLQELNEKKRRIEEALESAGLHLDGSWEVRFGQAGKEKVGHIHTQYELNQDKKPCATIWVQMAINRETNEVSLDKLRVAPKDEETSMGDFSDQVGRVMEAIEQTQ